MIVISDDLVLSLPDAGADLDNPVIGYDNLVSITNVSVVPVDAANPSYPVTNLANPSTNLHFRQQTPGQDFNLQVTLTGAVLVDYLAVAGHNFGSGARSLQVFGAVELDQYGDYVFTELTASIIRTNNRPIMFRFTSRRYLALRLNVVDTTGDTSICAVMYVGKLLACERKHQVSFTPIPYGRKREVLSRYSERGQFLGRFVIGQVQESSAHLSFLTPGWYRTFMDPFIDACATTPFFYAWAPVSYPFEVGYAWMMNDPVPQIFEPSRELWQVTLHMQGITE